MIPKMHGTIVTCSKWIINTMVFIEMADFYVFYILYLYVSLKDKVF